MTLHVFTDPTGADSFCCFAERPESFWRSSDKRSIRFVFTNLNYQMALVYAEHGIIVHSEESADEALIADYTARAEEYRKQFVR